MSNPAESLSPGQDSMVNRSVPVALDTQTPKKPPQTSRWAQIKNAGSAIYKAIPSLFSDEKNDSPQIKLYSEITPLSLRLLDGDAYLDGDAHEIPSQTQDVSKTNVVLPLFSDTDLISDSFDDTNDLFDLDVSSDSPDALVSSSDNTFDSPSQTPNVSTGILERAANKVRQFVNQSATLVGQTIEHLGDAYMNDLASRSEEFNQITQERFEVYGVNINPFHQTKRAVTSAKQLIIPNESVNTTTVLGKLSSVRHELDTRIDRIPETTAQAVLPPPIQTDLPPEEASRLDPLEELKQLESIEKAKFLTNLTKFASFRFFHETIMGNKPEDCMEYYNRFINSENPNELFYQEYGFLGRLCARVLLPIIQWIISLVLSNKAENANQKLSGISAVYTLLSDYLSNRENVRSEIKGIFSTANDYLLKLNTIYTDYANGEGGLLTLEEYINSRLAEDLEAAGISKKSIYSGLNEWIVNVINIQTGIPIIGCILDRLISSIMKPVLNKINIVEKSLEQGLSSQHSSPALVYGIKKLLSEKISQLNTQLKEQSDDSTFYQNAAFELTHEEKELLASVYDRLLNYLPLEEAREEDLPALLGINNSSRPRNASKDKISWFRYITEHLGTDWDQEIANNLEGPFKDLFGLFFQEFANQENRIQLWRGILERANSIFNQDRVEYTSDTLAAIHNELMEELSKLTDTLLDRQFDEELRIKHNNKTHEDAATFIQETKQSILNGVDQIQAIQQHLEKIDPETNPANIETHLHSLINQLRGFNSVIYNAVVDSQSYLLDADTRETFLTQIYSLVPMMEEMITIYDESLKSVPHLKSYQSMKLHADIDQGELTTEVCDTIVNEIDVLFTAVVSDDFSEMIQLENDKLKQTNKEIKNDTALIAQHQTLTEFLVQIKVKISSLLLQQNQRTQIQQLHLLYQQYIGYMAQLKLPISNLEEELVEFLANPHPNPTTLLKSLTTQIRQLELAIDECTKHIQDQKEILQEQMADLREAISSRTLECVDSIQRRGKSFFNVFNHILEAQERIHEPYRTTWNPGSKRIAELEKQEVSARVKKLLRQSCKVITNTGHLEQLMLRGPLSRFG